MNEWKHYIPLLEAIVELFTPLVEVAVHDLKKGELVALYHNLSQRKVGDPSPLKLFGIETKDFPDRFPPYIKENWDGRILKCTTVTIRDSKKRPTHLICINVDISFATQAEKILSAFLTTKREAENPIETYTVKSDEQMSELVDQYLNNEKLALSQLGRKEKKKLVWYLYEKGAFNLKNAANFVSNKLNLSRATIYNYLKEGE